MRRSIGNQVNTDKTERTWKNAPYNWTAIIMFIVTSIPVLTILPWYGLTYGFSTEAWIAFIAFYIFCGTGITVGYHRMWSHNAFEGHPIMRFWLAIWGGAALENTILDWCAGHRDHHRHVDDNDKDPYSAKRGFWFSHIGWMLRNYPSSRDNYDNVKNLQADPIVMWQYRNYGWIIFVMNFLLPLGLGFLVGDVWGMLLLAGFARIVLTHHTTFFINSLAHMWGSRPYTDENTARDNHFLAFFTFGEGYHNYHHIFQNDYRNGIKWWQFDPSKWIIKAGSWIGLTKNLRTVSDFKIQRAKITMQLKEAEQKLASKSLKLPEIKLSELKASIEKEYDELKQKLDEWTEIQSQKVQQTREDLKAKWEDSEVHARIKEIEASLKEQHKRLQQLNAQFA